MQRRKKIIFELIEPKKRKTVKKSYADNFFKLIQMFKFFTQERMEIMVLDRLHLTILIFFMDTSENRC